MTPPTPQAPPPPRPNWHISCGTSIPNSWGLLQLSNTRLRHQNCEIWVKNAQIDSNSPPSDMTPPTPQAPPPPRPNWHISCGTSLPNSWGLLQLSNTRLRHQNCEIWVQNAQIDSNSPPPDMTPPTPQAPPPPRPNWHISCGTSIPNSWGLLQLSNTRLRHQNCEIWVKNAQIDLNSPPPDMTPQHPKHPYPPNQIYTKVGGHQ